MPKPDRRNQTRVAGVVACVAAIVPAIACAQPANLKTRPGAELGANAAHIRYEEPDIAVTEKGYNAGIDFSYTATRENDWFMRGAVSFD